MKEKLNISGIIIGWAMFFAVTVCSMYFISEESLEDPILVGLIAAGCLTMSAFCHVLPDGKLCGTKEKDKKK